MVRALAPGLKADKACVGFVGLKPHAPSVNYRAIFLYTCWRDALAHFVDRTAVCRQGYAHFLRFLEAVFRPHILGQMLAALQAELFPCRAQVQACRRG